MIIATAGHVDHGKTSLVRTLTGIDTDRNPEEKRRGLTIDIGFAYMQDDDGRNIAIIDVPGHEKFVRNMIAGVGLVDIALLVVAADDGPMPQTIEHIAILQLMNAKLIVPVISKTDLVSSERQSQVVDAVSGLLQSAGLPTTDFYSMSVLDKSAVSNLKAGLLELIKSLPHRRVGGYFRMAIDRCFTLDGSGTVVTGTVSSGMLEKNDILTLVSDNSSEGDSARARGIHAQNTEATEASAGQRCAINLSGSLSREMLRRGGWMAADAFAVRTKVVDVVLSAAFSPGEDTTHSKRKVSHWTPGHLHLGTADIPCRIALLDTSSFTYGQTVLARLICERTVTASHNDRFVLRDQSARSTIAGGRVLDVFPPRRGRSQPARLKYLAALNTSTAAEALSNLLELHSGGVELTKFARQFNLLAVEVAELVENKALCVVNTASGKWCLTTSQSGDIEEKILETLLSMHKDNPDLAGVGLDVLLQATNREFDKEVLEYFVQKLIKQNRVVRLASVLRHAEHRVQMSQSDDECWKKIERELFTAGQTPLRLTELAGVLNKELSETRQFMNHCVAHGKVFKVTDNRYFLPATLKELAEIAESLSAADNLTVAEYRNKTGMGRNLVVELLEYFDRYRFTRRVGDKRTVLMTSAEAF